jgi:beta-glucosidase
MSDSGGEVTALVQFPKGFLWGTATAAHQVEGNNVNSESWVLEHVPGSMYAEPSGDAIDHYHRYRDDIALLARLGFNSYRFSIEWARIEPEEGQFSVAELEHYRRMLACCHEHGLTPIVTFHHFTSPRWLMRTGGWESADTPDKYARYCERAAKHLSDLIGAACTLNEPNLPALLTNMGFFPPAEHMRSAPAWVAAAQALGVAPMQLAPMQYVMPEKAFEVIVAAHRKGTAAIKSGPGNIPVGMTLALQDIQAGPGGEAVAHEKRHKINGVYLEALRGDDFVGVQTYSRARFGPHGLLPPEEGVEGTQMGYEFWPEALEATIRYAISITGSPVIVTENGLGSPDDTRRIEYIRRALRGVANCLRDGLDVRGYLYWSAFDNFEWNMGYRPTFGLIAVDRSTQQRSPKPSAQFLGEIAKANAIPH